MRRYGPARADDSLPASLEAIAESIPHIVWLADPAGVTDYFNGRGAEYTGQSRRANYGWNWVTLVHPDDADRARVGWEHATRTVIPFTLSYRILRHDGQYRWHAFRALPVEDPDGHVVRWIGTADELDGGFPADDQRLVERQAAELRAMLGTVATVATIDGKAEVKIPPGTSSGKKLRLRGKGMPDGTGGHGDHYVTVQIDVPHELDDEAKKLLVQLATRVRKRGHND